MNIEDVRSYCLSKPLATEDMPFGGDYLAFRISGKIFAGIPLNQPHIFVLKCSPELFDEVTEQYPSIEQAWHWHKKHMLQIHLDGYDITDDLVKELTDKAFALVYNKLTRKQKAELLLANNGIDLLIQ